MSGIYEDNVITIEYYSNLEDIKNMSQGNNCRIYYKNYIVNSEDERSKVKNLKKCLELLVDIL